MEIRMFKTVRIDIDLQTELIYAAGGVYNVANNNTLIRFFLDNNLAEEVKEPEYTETDMIQFAQYCDTGKKMDLPWYGAFLIGGNWRQK